MIVEVSNETIDVCKFIVNTQFPYCRMKIYPSGIHIFCRFIKLIMVGLQLGKQTKVWLWLLDICEPDPK